MPNPQLITIKRKQQFHYSSISTISFEKKKKKRFSFRSTIISIQENQEEKKQDVQCSVTNIAETNICIHKQKQE